MAVVNIEKLNHRNYGSWSSDMKYLLLENNLWDIIEKEKLAPDSDADKNGFISFANQSLSIIYLNIDIDFKRIIDECVEPVSA